MGAKMGGETRTDKSKAVELSDAINRMLFELSLKCSKDEGIRDYYDICILGYGKNVGSALSKVFPERLVVPISELASSPARIEERSKICATASGDLVEQSVKFPVWVEPVRGGGTPMCESLSLAKSIISRWIEDHRQSFPPIVIHITDGGSSDGNPTALANELTQLRTSDGNVLLFNLHLSSASDSTVLYPSTAAGLSDKHAVLLFNLSSELTDFMRLEAQREGLPVTTGSRGFAFNADLVTLINFLDIGTRPSNLR